MINRKKTNGSTKSEGTVQMTLEAYKGMLLELQMYRDSVTVQKDWRTELTMVINPKVFYPIAEELVKEKFPSATMKPEDEVYNLSVTVAYLPEEEIEE